MEPRKPIFEVYKSDLLSDTDNLHHFVNRSHMFQTDYGSTSLNGLINDLFVYWPGRKTAFTQEEFLTNIGISNDSLARLPFNNDTLALNYIEFIKNICEWINAGNRMARPKDNAENHHNFQQMFTNIDEIIKSAGYRFEFINNQFVIIINNQELTDVLEFSDDPDALKTLLIQYARFNNSKEEDKEKLLAAMNKYLERYNNSKFKPVRDLADDVSFILNRMAIRHKEDTDLQMSDVERNKWCDRCFDIIVHMINAERIQTYDEELQLIKTSVKKAK